ncbi:uncharacterized protein LOC128863443 [Anastrepha ludens]|uniref:uncharacterized protein LOC128863443 n=1 Tax=Anastrepha ludens TaxID=28586 RepID=UPI0023B02A1E|nr:uncharacterized protein LOC128863443 [Anastrepha ludens]XP_053958578.1 uncharacterized protein LOC128863443 [Anastrepha ludens]
MENLQGRNGSSGTFFKKNSETEKLAAGRCGTSAHVGAGIGAANNFAAVQDDCNCIGNGSGSGSWLTCGQQHIQNNNNNNSTESNVQAKYNVGITTTGVAAAASIATVALAISTTDASCTGIGIKSEGGGGIEDDSTERKPAGVRAGFATADSTCNAMAGATAKSIGDLKQNCASCIALTTPIPTQDAMAAAAADVITPSDFNACTFDVFSAAAAAAATAVVSRSASLNNSTENLSYTSDNYADDLLLLEGDDDIDDVDVDAEEISLNSDDCVYAYRGDGADFDLALDAIAGRGHGTSNTCMADDETDFLEMDFEPDPLSEVEYGSVETAPGHADAFLMQRDACHLSGRHSATLSHYTNATTGAQRLLFSSPIDDSLPPPPTKTLQSQLLLSKNYARITMHLDQIKGENGDCNAYERTHSDRTSALGMVDDTVDAVPKTGVINAAHSLPNALLSNFGRNVLHTKEESKANPSKVTGAKPKRYSTFSTSSSTSSKNSSKSRNSLRSTYAPTTLSNSASFDERSASCTEFRCAAPKMGASTENCMHAETGLVTSTATTTNDCDDSSANDDTCLDCLEKEFLANTIGKAVDLNECPSCRKRSSSNIALFKRAAQTSTGATRCRSGSPLIFRDTRDDCIFETIGGDNLQPRNVDWATSAFRDIRMLKDDRWLGDSVSCDDSGPCAGNSKLKPRVRTRVRARTCDAEELQHLKSEEEGINQRRATNDINNEHLLKNLVLTEKEFVTVATLNLSEELLVQALDKLHVSYNLELIKSYFYYASNAANTTATTTMPLKLKMHKNVKELKDLKHLLMHESKKHCNHHKLKCLIEFATRQQVDVQFEQVSEETSTILVPIRVTDILQHWVRTKNLEVLKHLDKRFAETNVLGKIANIIRQAQQRCSQRRALPEYIMIPQYYPAGVLRLTRKS